MTNPSSQQIDENYVGDPPKVEVAIENLNDNVDPTFLRGLVAKCGTAEEVTIGHHPATRKHLGVARIVFEEVRAAKECVRALHGRSVMGKHLQCYLDPSGAHFRRLFQELTAEKKPQEQQEPSPELPEADTAVQDEPPPPPPPPSSAPSSAGKYGGERRGDPRGDPRSSDSRERRDRHSGSRGRRGDDGGSGSNSSRRHSADDHHRKSRRDSRGGGQGYSQESSTVSERERDASAEADYSQPPLPPPPPLPAGLSQPPQPPPPMGGAAAAAAGALDSHYQPTAFDPQYSQPEYWLKQAKMYTAGANSAAAATSRSASQDSSDSAAASAAAAAATGAEGPSDYPPSASSSSSGLPVPPPPPPSLMHPPPPDLLKDLNLGALTGGVDDDGEADGEVAAAMAGAEQSSNQVAVSTKSEGDRGDDAGQEEEDDHKVDLDTRLKMLMRDKSGAMPAFLLTELNDSDNEDEEEEKRKKEEEEAKAKTEVKAEVEHGEYNAYYEQQQKPPASVVFPLHADEVPLSRPPSPFLSTKEYLKCHTEWVAERRAREDELRNRHAMEAAAAAAAAAAAGFMPPHHHPFHQQFFAAAAAAAGGGGGGGGSGRTSRRNGGNRERRPRSRNSDQMSLSSLSSGENNILEEGPDAAAAAAAAAAYYAAYYQHPPLPGEGGVEGDYYGGPSSFPPHQIPPPPPMIDPNTGLPVMPPFPYDGYYDQWWAAAAAAGEHDFGHAQQAAKDPKSNIRPLVKYASSSFCHSTNLCSINAFPPSTGNRFNHSWRT